MSDSTVCSHCGAALEPNRTSCAYCGATVILNSSITWPSDWSAVTNHIPPPSPNDPNKSIYVLVCGGIENGKKMTVGGKDISLSPYGANGLYSLYYDFKDQTWKNDLYGKKVYLNNHPPIVTHWMLLPPASQADWILAKDCLPEGGAGTIPINVLTCRKGPNYEPSIILGNVSYNDCDFDTLVVTPHWEGLVGLDIKNDDTIRRIDVTHWMPIPPGPTK